MLRVLSATLITLMASMVMANEAGQGADPDVPSKTGLVESVEVRTYYLCDGYDSYGDASFYDCAQRFFREGVRPAGEKQLEGKWRCRSAVNGPTANHEQVVKFGHYKKGRPGGSFVDKLLVQRIFADNPKPKQMYRDYLDKPLVIGVRFNALVGEIAKGDLDWVSTNWAYVQVTETLKFFGRKTPGFYDARSAFRFYEGRLLIEHVVRTEDRNRFWKVVTEDPRSTDAREHVREKRARGEPASITDAVRLIDELINEEVYENGNPYRTAWTEDSLRTATPIAQYAVVKGEESDWSFPITYSECQRYWD